MAGGGGTRRQRVGVPAVYHRYYVTSDVCRFDAVTHTREKTKSARTPTTRQHR